MTSLRPTFCRLLLFVSSSIYQSSSHLSSENCSPHQPYLANFTHRHLREVPSRIPDHTTTLDLGYNNISRIPDKVFQDLHRLMRLTLSNNNIVFLESKALFGLKVLCYLDLSQNPLTQQSFPSKVFLPIPNLIILQMKHVPLSDWGTFPDDSFENLKNVRELYITTMNKLVLKSRFSLFPNLETVDLTGSEIPHLDNGTFSALKKVPVRTLSLKNCSIQTLDINTFGPLMSLANLDLSHNWLLGLNQAFRSLYGLQHRSMTTINFRHVNSPGNYELFDNFIIDGIKTRFLATICVKRLDLGRNYVTFIKKDFFYGLRFPLCLTYFSISDHRINTFNSDYLGVLSLRNLEVFDGQGSKGNVISQTGMRKQRFKQPNVPPLTSSRKRQINSVIFPLPVSLRYIDISHIAVAWSSVDVQFEASENLTFLDVSSNGFRPCHIPFEGATNLRTLKINQLNCSVLSPGLLASYPELEELEMAGIGLGLQVTADRNSDLLSRQRNLTKLNMMDNGIVEMHQNFFRSLKQVTSLNLKDNKLSQIPKTLRSLSSLKELDISYNAITHIKKPDRLFLEALNQISRLTVDFEGNPLTCSCDTVEFVQWVIETPVTIVKREKLSCGMTNGSRVFIYHLREGLNDFRVNCISKFWLTFSLTATSLSIASIFVLVIVYRYRYNIKYWCLTKCHGDMTYDVIGGDNYQFDAFVAYNHNNVGWVCEILLEFLENRHQYKLCLHHRDFQAGEFIQQNIVNSVNSSRKTILVISRKFLECDWGEFEIEMASMRMAQQGRQNVVIVILLDDIPVREMPRCLLNMWKQITFLLWTEEPGDRRTFFERLEQAMVR